MKKLITLLLLAPWLSLFAQETNEIPEEVKRLVSNLQYQKGEIALKGDLAKLTVPENFRYLSPEDADIVLTQLWGNPASDDKTLGMIIPAKTSPLDPECWAVIITYTDDGYVKDSDADKIDYADLLKDMQEGTAEYNKERKKEGYGEIKLVGWATAPRYDKATHKMYWAKELAFEGSEENTLNYNIRVLGRGGVLVLNVVAGMSQLQMIEEHAPEIVKMIDFKEGNRYADFNDKTDKVAAYGLAALVAGGIATKAGFFKVLLVGLLAAKKFVIVGLIGVVVFVKKLLGRKEAAKQKETV